MQKKYLLLFGTLIILTISVSLFVVLKTMVFKTDIFSDFQNKNYIQKNIDVVVEDTQNNNEDSLYDDSEQEFNNDTVGNDTSEKTYENVRTSLSEDVIEELYSIISDELYVLWDKNNINEITNHEKLQVAIEKYASINGYSHYSAIKSFSAEQLEKSFESTSIGYLSLNHENIKPFIKLVTLNGDAFIYDSNTKTYTATIFGGDASVIAPYQEFLVDSYYENEIYFISYKYVWAQYPDAGPFINLYLSYEDTYEHKNAVYYYSGTTITNDMLDILEAGKDTYIENNKDFILQNATAYNYIFKRGNNQFILVDFYKS